MEVARRAGEELAGPTIVDDGAADGFRQIDLALGGHAEAGAALQGAPDRLDDGGMPVSQNERAPGADVVDILDAIDIIDIGALCPLNEKRISSNSGEINNESRSVTVNSVDILEIESVFAPLEVSKIMVKSR